MSGQKRLLGTKEILQEQETLVLIRSLMGAQMRLRQAREKDDLAGVRKCRRWIRQLQGELRRRDKDSFAKEGNALFMNKEESG